MANEEHREENKNNSNSEHSDLPELGINTSGAPDLETLVQAASEGCHICKTEPNICHPYHILSFNFNKFSH